MSLFGGNIEEYIITWVHDGEDYFEDSSGLIFDNPGSRVVHYMTKQEAEAHKNKFKTEFIDSTHYNKETDAKTLKVISKKEIEKIYED